MNVEQEIDHIYEVMSELMVEGRFASINSILNDLNVAETPTEVLLGYLTSVFLVRDEIKYPEFKSRVAYVLQARHPNKWDAMMHGL